MKTLLLLSLAVASLARPADLLEEGANSTLENRADDTSYRYEIQSDCRGRKDWIDERYSRDQYTKIEDAVSMAIRLAQAAVQEWWNEGQHGPAASLYLAIPDDGKYKENKYAQRVHENLKSVVQLSGKGTGPTIKIHCDDIRNRCAEIVEGTQRKVTGYAENIVDNGNGYDIVLCETWFKQQGFEELRNNYGPLSSFPNDQITMELLETDAGKMLHEMMHIDLLVAPRPHINDVFWRNGERAYTAPKIASWVSEGAKTEFVVQNADSYTQFVTAVWATSEFGYLPPPEKIAQLSEKFECFEGWGNYVDAGQARHIDEFCDDVEKDFEPGSATRVLRRYDEDTPDMVEFEFNADKRADMGSESLRDYCREVFMPRLFHECNDDTKWKTGGKIENIRQAKQPYVEFSWEFSPRSTKTTERPYPIPDQPPARCSASFLLKSLLDRVVLKGGLFASSDWGQRLLRPALEKCGYIQDWQWLYYKEAQSGGYEWEAMMLMEDARHSKSCIRDAMIAAGAPHDMEECGDFLTSTLSLNPFS